MKPSRICCVIPSLQSGGMERVMVELINGFINYFCVDVHVILYGMNRDIFYTINENAIIHRPVFHFDNNKRTISTLKTLLYLRKEVKKINPDAILSFGNLWNTFILLALVGTKYPVYISDRGAPCFKSGRFQECLKSWLYPKSAGIVAQTLVALNIYKKQFPSQNYTVIGNPIREIKTDNSIKKENIVLFVGRLIKTKHVDRLITLFHELNRQDWKLVVVGGDAQNQNIMEKLKVQLSELGNPSNIELTGMRKDVENYLNRAKIFAFTSSSEGFPNVIGEAMSAGLPVVSYDCVAGPSDMIDDGVNGYLVPVFDDELFKKRLLELMNSEKKREQMGGKAKESIKSFAVEHITKKFYSFITSKNL